MADSPRARPRPFTRTELRSARRALRELERIGRGPGLHVQVRIVGEEWGSPGDVIGLAGINTEIPFTRAGIRHLARILRQMRLACIRSVARDARERRKETTPP